MRRSGSEPDDLSRSFVDWTLKWGAWLWAAALLLAIPASYRTFELYAHLRSELEQLLPESAPSVVAIRELRARVPGSQYLGVVADAPDEDSLPAAERLLDDLASRVHQYPPDLVRAVRTGDEVERTFIANHAPLYMDFEDLDTIRRRIEARRDWQTAKETGALLDEGAPPPPLDFEDIQKNYEGASRANRFDDGRFASKRLHRALMLIEVGEFDTGRRRGEALLDRVKADLRALDPDRRAPGLRIGFTGDVAINVEETQALVTDLSVSSVLVIALVIAVIVFYYQWWRSVFILLPPLLLATVFAFALASLPPLRVAELNSNTAFLGSIILGNGINFGIVLLGRYVEERRLGRTVRDAMVHGVWGARTGTLSAALAAGVSYASLALTSFRGFRQFGFIGGAGMVLSWLFAFVLMPPLAAWCDRAPRLPAPRRDLMAGLGRFVQRFKIPILLTGAVLALCAGWAVRGFGPDQIETDFSKLRRADTWTAGEGYWGRRMDELLGTYVTPTMILADDADQARAIGKELRHQPGSSALGASIASVRTVDDVLPRDQEQKIRTADAIREDLTPAIRASLTDQQRKLVDDLFGRGPLRPVGVTDVPATLLAGLQERSGAIGRTVLVYPRPDLSLWERKPLADFVAGLRGAAAIRVSPEEKPARVAGALALSSDILDSVRRDGAIASVAAFVGVVGVVLLLLRARESTVLVLGSLLVGVLWMAGASTALGIKINFANFIAFPITFGIGVDYSVNVASRWELDGRGPMAAVVRTTGGAVLLCSATTIIGYSSLLLAQNRALFLFGLLAVLGEIACLATAVVVLPAFVEWIRSRRDRPAHGLRGQATTPDARMTGSDAHSAHGRTAAE
ncbi:MAG: MMPL family transporter [Myxococcota bacterium]|nr:MMPL family transporter [Myxococcota bacterium]